MPGIEALIAKAKELEEAGEHPIKVLTSNQDLFDTTTGEIKYTKAQINEFLNHINFNDPNGNTRDNMPNLHHFLGHKVLLECFNERFSEGVDWNKKNGNGQDAAFFTVSINKLDVLDMLHEQNKVRLDTIDSQGYNLLETALASHNPPARELKEIAKQVIDYGLTKVDASKNWDDKQIELMNSLKEEKGIILESQTKKISKAELIPERSNEENIAIAKQFKKSFKQERDNIVANPGIEDQAGELNWRAAPILTALLYPNFGNLSQPAQGAASVIIRNEIPKISNSILEHEQAHQNEGIISGRARSASIHSMRFFGSETRLETEIRGVTEAADSAIRKEIEKSQNLTAPVKNKSSTSLAYGANAVVPADLNALEYNSNNQATRRDTLTIASQSFNKSPLGSINEASNIQQQSGSTPSNNKGPQQGVTI